MSLEVTVTPHTRDESSTSAQLSLGKKSLTVETSASVPLDQSATPWLAPALLVAMRHDVSVTLPGPVDATALAGADQAQKVMNSWYPQRMRRVEIDATAAEPATAPDGRGVGCFFSGGVDSFYSTVKHLDEITHLIFIHGFDIALDNEDLAERSRRALREAARDLGRPLIEVRTNLRQVHARFGLDWEAHSHGSLLAHVSLLLAPHLRKVYLPSSFVAGELVPYATHPDLDPLWSSSRVEIVHDGLEAARAQKIAAFADNEAAMNNLRVCWYNKDNDYNCGRCEKCLRTMINIKIAGAAGKCRTLPAEVDLDLYDHTYMNSGGVESAKENLNVMKVMGYEDPELEAALRRAIDRPRLANELLHARKLASLAPEFVKFVWKQGRAQLGSGRG